MITQLKKLKWFYIDRLLPLKYRMAAYEKWGRKEGIVFMDPKIAINEYLTKIANDAVYEEIFLNSKTYVEFKKNDNPT